VWEELPAEIRQQLESEQPQSASESKPQPSSLFAGEKLSPAEKKILALLKEHESTHIDEIIEKLEGLASSSEIFTALFELELSGKIKQMPGKNYVKSF
jgi:DNA processing protein